MITTENDYFIFSTLAPYSSSGFDFQKI